MDRDSAQPPDDLRPELSNEQVLYDEADIPPAIHEFVFWLGGAVSGGILGNATYDALKAALGALRRSKDGPALNETEVVAFAREAARLRSRRNGEDGNGGFEVTAVEQTAGGWSVELTGSTTTLRVRLPQRRDRNGIVQARVRDIGFGRSEQAAREVLEDRSRASGSD
ncbi:hypothetical protein [Micromonospora echinaurantiaca]|uniref:hypothetical protein n=1 Tax=Micromonospora echinaurantiaca TaxID=47857 RepID=UPI000B5AD80A|nr:hypothetical protein [Micromonospora echinaurantiaca]